MPVCHAYVQMHVFTTLAFIFFLSFYYWLLKKYFSAMFYDLKKNPIFSSPCKSQQASRGPQCPTLFKVLLKATLAPGPFLCQGRTGRKQGSDN